MARKPNRTQLSAKILDAWYEWFTNRNCVPPQVTGATGAAAKSLASYFYAIATKKNGHLSEEMLEAGCLGMMEYILHRWSSLDPFIQKQVKLEQINSNITNIIDYLKHGKRNSKNIDTASAFEKIDRFAD